MSHNTSFELTSAAHFPQGNDDSPLIRGHNLLNPDEYVPAGPVDTQSSYMMHINNGASEDRHLEEAERWINHRSPDGSEANPDPQLSAFSSGGANTPALETDTEVQSDAGARDTSTGDQMGNNISTVKYQQPDLDSILARVLRPRSGVEEHDSDDDDDDAAITTQPNPLGGVTESHVPEDEEEEEREEIAEQHVGVWVGFALSDSVLGVHGRHAIDLNVKIRTATTATLWDKLLANPTTISRRLTGLLDRCTQRDLYLGTAPSPIDVNDRSFSLPENGYRELTPLSSVASCTELVEFADERTPATTRLRQAQNMEADRIPLLVLYVVDVNRQVEVAPPTSELPIVHAEDRRGNARDQGSGTNSNNSAANRDNNYLEDFEITCSYLRLQFPSIDEAVERYAFRSQQVSNNNYFGKAHWGSAYSWMVALFLVHKILQHHHCHERSIPTSGLISRVILELSDDEGNIQEREISVTLELVIKWLGIQISSSTYKNWVAFGTRVADVRRNLHSRSERHEEISVKDSILQDNLTLLTIPDEVLGGDEDENEVVHTQDQASANRLDFLPDFEHSGHYSESPEERWRLFYPGVRNNSMYHRVLKLGAEDLDKDLKAYMSEHNVRP
ncbi:hypothetical protein SCHPADRAFT_947152 [Schizopora paradoxa]|uniref:Uncharacterized protein n=1 Tax=Schizopora paradoxa TaxID=27342 RepID=A0A0H2R042_9AGAM|nr:hypothetical protein SCHPADRAFT_947152 [Schizopora paradoxa]